MQLLFDSIIKGSINNRKFAKKEIIINLNLFFSIIEREINGVFLQRTKGAAITHTSKWKQRCQILIYFIRCASLWKNIFHFAKKRLWF